MSAFCFSSNCLETILLKSLRFSNLSNVTPSGSVKSLTLKFLSSGLLYRYASYLIIRYDPKNRINFLKSKFRKLNYKNLNRLNLQTPKISDFSAKIARVNEVRQILKKFQINFSKILFFTKLTPIYS